MHAGADVNRASKVAEGDTRGPSGGETPIFMAARAGHNQVTTLFFITLKLRFG